MADDHGNSHNRRARRAAARASGETIAAPTTTPKMKMALPDYSKPKGKTLLDVYEDNKDLLSQGQPFDAKYEDGLVRDEHGNIIQADVEAELVGPVADAFFWAVSLGSLHFTLDVLAQNQYRQDLDWELLFRRSGTMLPILWIVVFLLKTKYVRRWYYVRQSFFLLVAVVIGNHTIYVANIDSYYAVMKQVPPLGTLWIWSVIEMNLGWAATSLFINIAYVLWNGYAVF